MRDWLRAAVWTAFEWLLWLFPALGTKGAPMGVDRMNIGTGGAAQPGWFNIDFSLSAWLVKYPRLRTLLYRLHVLSAEEYGYPWPRDAVIHDARLGLLVPDGSMRYIYTSHFLEHLYRDETRRVLQDCFRVLTPGGLIRVAVPDLALAVREYLVARPPDAPLPDPCSPEETQMLLAPVERLMTVLMWPPHRIPDRMPHRWMYDAESLCAELVLAGFVAVRRCEYGQGQAPEVAALDNRPESLFMEARKPGGAHG